LSSPRFIGLEICVDSVAGLRAAAENGADRIELCAALSEGGLTPSKGTMLAASSVATPVRAMIRPRAGNFTYDRTELDIMRRDIEEAAAAHLQGVALGCNDTSGDLDEAALTTLVDHAHAFGLAVTLHRSFDLVSDPLYALNGAAALRIDTILTSGQQDTASAGLELIGQLVEVARKKNVEIMAGSGVIPSTVEPLVTRAGVNYVHASCRYPPGHSRESSGAVRRYMVEHRETDPMLIARLRRTLDEFKPASLAGADA
jgi:copper homeostasis protein